MAILPLDKAVDYYNLFLTKYAERHNYNGTGYTHSIPSSFVYNLVKDDCLWLLTLLIGVAGYSVYFDNDTTASRVISKSLLDECGIKDPALKYKSSLEPWTGLLSKGKSPTDPISGAVTTGVGIAHYNASGLGKFYRAENVNATLPVLDQNGLIVRKDGIMQTTNYTFTYNGEKICGWGLSYGKKCLPIDALFNHSSGLCTCTNNGRSALKGKTDGKNFKLIGPSFGKQYKDYTYYMDKIGGNQFLDWCKYHFDPKNDPKDPFYPVAIWMASYWAPVLSWHDGTKENSPQAVMALSAFRNSGFPNADKFNGKSLESIIDGYLKIWSSDELEHGKRRVYNVLRAITLVEFIKRV